MAARNLLFSAFRRRSGFAPLVFAVTGGFLLSGSIWTLNAQEKQYSLEEVANHKSRDDKGIWVHYNGDVYDITQFLDMHPGGKIIELAAGGDLEPFWNSYPIHSTGQAIRLLPAYRIGRLSNAALEKLKENRAKTPLPNDPYGNEPSRHPALQARSAKPFNAETPASVLSATYDTPNDLFFVRNHLPVPVIDPSSYRLEVVGEGVTQPLVLSLEDLKKRFKTHSVSSTIMCAGNQRNFLSKVRPLLGLDWQSGAIGNATWTGVRLIDVLKEAGFDVSSPPANVRHLQLEGFDTGIDGTIYGGSIPIEKACGQFEDVILAFEMNGKPIPSDHGFPVRAIVPGTVGARNVKWLRRIVLSTEESMSAWQRNDYKVLSACVSKPSPADYAKSSAIQEAPVLSAITSPQPGAKITSEDSEVEVKGYAYSGGGRGITRVEVTSDGGKTWTNASLTNGEQKINRSWAWTQWEATVTPPKFDSKIPERFQVCVRAVDLANNSQPQNSEHTWNVRGFLGNAWPCVEIECK